MFKMSFESPTYAGLMTAIVEAASLYTGSSSAPTGAAAGQNFQPNGAVTHTDPDAGPVNTNAPALDSAGLPWDERIHSANKATIGDGTWRKRRGVDPATVASVEMALRHAMAGPGAAPAGQTFNPNPAGNFQPNVQTFQPNVQQQPQQTYQPQQTFQPNPGFDPNTGQHTQQFQPQVQQQPAQQPEPVNFGGLMAIISAGMQAQTLNNNDIAALCQNLGIANIALVQNDPARIDAAVKLLRAWGKIQ